MRRLGLQGVVRGKRSRLCERQGQPMPAGQDQPPVPRRAAPRALTVGLYRLQYMAGPIQLGLGGINDQGDIAVHATAGGQGGFHYLR